MPHRNELTAAQARDLARHFLGEGWTAIAFGPANVRLIGPAPQGHIFGPFFNGTSWRSAFRAAGVKLPLRSQFTAHKERVMDGERCVATACTPTFAKRTANALNSYEPDRRGI